MTKMFLRQQPHIKKCIKRLISDIKKPNYDKKEYGGNVLFIVNSLKLKLIWVKTS